MSLATFIGIDETVLQTVRKEMPHLNAGEHKALRSWIVNGKGATKTLSGLPTTLGAGHISHDIAQYAKYAEEAMHSIKGDSGLLREAIAIGKSFASHAHGHG